LLALLSFAFAFDFAFAFAYWLWLQLACLLKLQLRFENGNIYILFKLQRKRVGEGDQSSKFLKSAIFLSCWGLQSQINLPSGRAGMVTLIFFLK
jgi:hypothetical protein